MSGDWLFKVVPFFICFVFILILGWWVLVGTALYQIASDPGATAHRIGEIAGAAANGFNAASQK